MGVILFLAAAVIEIAFAFICLITKSELKKSKSIVRMAELAVFVLIAVLQVIDFDASYFALAALLFILAVIGAVRLIRKNQQTGSNKPIRIVLKALGMTALIFAATLPAIIFPGYHMLEPTGAYRVRTATYTYTDTGRIETFTNMGEFRKVNIGMWFPENADGKYPLIVFSHGGISSRTSNESLYHELASHGYVVCSIDHPYHSMSTTDFKGNTVTIDSGYMRELNEENAKTNRIQSFELYQKWMKLRTDDMNFVIDHIRSLTENENSDMVYRCIDAKKIGVMGHSLGGSAALGIGRKRDDIRAVIALESPFMCDITGVKDAEFVFTDEVYPIPVLNVYSDSTWSHLAQLPQYAQNHKLLSDIESEAFNVYISGAGHFTLTDLALTSPILTGVLNGFSSATDTEYCLRTINKVCLEFFDAYLKQTAVFTSDGTY